MINVLKLIIYVNMLINPQLAFHQNLYHNLKCVIFVTALKTSFLLIILCSKSQKMRICSLLIVKCSLGFHRFVMLYAI
jgi:hypothetical protein